jgi:tripartite-type tricarboxylate transporter receptor subunit TctC
MTKPDSTHAHATARRQVLRGLCAVAVLPALGGTRLAAAQATGYPDRPVRMLFGYPPGGGADVIARIQAEVLHDALQQGVIVDNRPGATGNIAAQLAAHAPPDGYTLFFGTAAEIAINKQVTKDMGFDPDVDFVPIVMGFNVPLALVVSSKSDYRTLNDLIAAARANPGKLNFASSGSGTPGHLAGETLASRTGTKMTHIPYKGGGPALSDLMGGHVDFYFASLNSVLPLVKAGNLRALALSSPRRSQLVPDIPTVAELAVPDFDFTIWGGLFAPAKTPAGIVALLNRDINEGYRRPDIRQKLNAEGSEVADNSQEQFASFVRAEGAKYARIVKEVGYTGQ